MIYTSYFAVACEIPDSVVKVAISRGAPVGFSGVTYAQLAPSWSLVKACNEGLSEKDYVRQYYMEVLSKLDSNQVLSKIIQINPGGDVVLLCYEPPDRFCHRHVVASWLKSEAGADVREWS